MRELYGLFGASLSHSVSPQIHSLIMEKANVAGYYHLFEVKKDDLQSALTGLKLLGANGANVTIPYKTEIIKYLDKISDEAKRIGAVNTIKFDDTNTIGYNTDYNGIDFTFHKFNITTENKTALILGNGGAAITLVHYLMDKGVKDIAVACRDVNKVKADPSFNGKKIISFDEIALLPTTDILINCTPIGMYPKIDSAPIDKNMVSKFGAVFDLIYNPKRTLLLGYAEELGLKYANGLYMLVAQAVYAQHIWNNISFDDSLIEEIHNEIEMLFVGEKQ